MGDKLCLGADLWWKESSLCDEWKVKAEFNLLRSEILATYAFNVFLVHWVLYDGQSQAGIRWRKLVTGVSGQFCFSVQFIHARVATVCPFESMGCAPSLKADTSACLAWEIFHNHMYFFCSPPPSSSCRRGGFCKLLQSTSKWPFSRGEHCPAASSWHRSTAASRYLCFPLKWGCEIQC